MNLTHCFPRRQRHQRSATNCKQQQQLCSTRTQRTGRRPVPWRSQHLLQNWQIQLTAGRQVGANRTSLEQRSPIPTSFRDVQLRRTRARSVPTAAATVPTAAIPTATTTPTTAAVLSATSAAATTISTTAAIQPVPATGQFVPRTSSWAHWHQHRIV